MSTNVEERMRRALSARAGQITPGRLQPAVPPTAAPARRSWLPWWRSLLVVAAVLVAVVFAVRRPGDDPAPQVPNAPAVTVPSPSLSPSPSSRERPVTPTEPPPPSTGASRSVDTTATVPVPTTFAPVAPEAADATGAASPDEPPATSPAATPRLAR